MKNDPEFKRRMGEREADSDGFTYVHGRFKNGRKKRTRNKARTKLCRRHDKRAARGKAMARVIREA